MLLGFDQYRRGRGRVWAPPRCLELLEVNGIEAILTRCCTVEQLNLADGVRGGWWASA